MTLKIQVEVQKMYHNVTNYVGQIGKVCLNGKF